MKKTIRQMIREVMLTEATTKELLAFCGKPLNTRNGMYKFAGEDPTWRQVVKKAKSLGLEVDKGGNGQGGTYYMFNRNGKNPMRMHVSWMSKEFVMVEE